MSRIGAIRRVGLVAALATLGVFVVITLRGPHGLAALRKKQEEIRALQERNAELKREIDERRNRNRRLRENPEEQELEIRKRLNLLKRGEKYFVVPEAPPAPEPR